MVSFAMQIVIVLGSWFILMLITTNLVGFSVRGLLKNPDIEDTASHSMQVAEEYKKSQSWTTMIGFTSTVIFLFAIYNFGNIGWLIASLMLMAARAPDLKWEVTRGRKLQMNDMDKPKFYLLTTLLSWASLPVVWYALYRM